MLVSLSYLSILTLIFSGVAQAWIPGPGGEEQTTGFTVDVSSRDDVLSFYHSVYQKSEQYKQRGAADWIGGSVASGQVGSLSDALVGDTERRINFYRAMCGLPANVTLNGETDLIIVDTGGKGKNRDNSDPATPKYVACQEAALMFAAQGQIDHFPPSSWPFWTDEAANAAKKSNLTHGSYGPGAIDTYVADSTAGNEAVGHRRWLLYPRATLMATGDAPVEKMNVLYVMQREETKGPALYEFVSWPNEGFCPDELVPRRWSLSFPGANFSGASVTVRDAGGQLVATSIESSSDNGYGDPSLVWSVDGFPKSVAEDEVYTVEVTGVSGASSSSYTYVVKVFDPDHLSSPLVLQGDASVPSTGGTLTFDSVAVAEGYELEVASLTPADWVEGGEDPVETSFLADHTDVSYDLRSSGSFSGDPGMSYLHAGAVSLRLAPPHHGYGEQVFELGRGVIPEEGALLKFHYMRGWMEDDTKLTVQVSSDGVEWEDHLVIAGGITLDPSSGAYLSGFGDGAYQQASVPLEASNKPVFIRFRLTSSPVDAHYSVSFNPTGPVGIFLDDIEVDNALSLGDIAETSYTATASSVPLDGTTAGEDLVVGKTYIMRLRAKVGLTWMSYGPAKEVLITEALLNTFESWSSAMGVEAEIMTDNDGDGAGNLQEYAFATDPQNGEDFMLEGGLVLEGGNAYLRDTYNTEATDVVISAEYSSDLVNWSPLSVTFTDGEVEAMVPMSSEAQCFIRWKVTQN